MPDPLDIPSGERLLRRPEVRHRTGWSNSAIDRAITAGLCPKPVRIGKRAVAWVESEIDELVARLIRDGRAGK